MGTGLVETQQSVEDRKIEQGGEEDCFHFLSITFCPSVKLQTKAPPVLQLSWSLVINGAMGRRILSLEMGGVFAITLYSKALHARVWQFRDNKITAITCGGANCMLSICHRDHLWPCFSINCIFRGTLFIADLIS